MVILSDKQVVKQVCIKSSGEIVRNNECSQEFIWKHVYSVPKECKPLFSFTAKPYIELVFPIYYAGGLRKFCLIIKEKSILSYSHEKLVDLVEDVIESLRSREEISIEDVLVFLYKALISYYHRELSNLDNSIENFINRVIRGELFYEPIYRLYNRASHLHRGVHGIIYSLQCLDRFYPNLKDLGDEAIMLENMYSTSIDRITQAFNLYYTLISERTNRVVTKLTIISAIFLPLSLIAGIYGMNFRYMPELQHPLAYPITLSAMAVIAIGELLYFKIKKWI